MNTSQIDRRPIKSRDARWAHGLTDRLVRWGVSANAISVCGMISGIAAGICFAFTYVEQLRFVGFLVGALCVQLRLIANMLDGMVAIASQTNSPVGELYNEVPDRVSDTATLVGCGYAMGGTPLLGYWVTILAIFIAYIRATGCVAGSPQYYIGPMAKQHRMFVVTLFAIISAFLPLQTWFHLPWDPNAGWMTMGLMIILLGECITIYRRLNKIQQYLRSSQQDA